MEVFFVVPIMDIDPSWSLRAFHHDIYASEYCRLVLGIPSDHIEHASLCDNKLEVSLVDSEESMDADWYIQLRRISR